jgi:hypothetical protein
LAGYGVKTLKFTKLNVLDSAKIFSTENQQTNKNTFNIPPLHYCLSSKQRSLTREFYFLFLFIFYFFVARAPLIISALHTTLPFSHEVQSSCKGRFLHVSLDTRARPTKRRSSINSAQF